MYDKVAAKSYNRKTSHLVDLVVYKKKNQGLRSGNLGGHSIDGMYHPVVIR